MSVYISIIILPRNTSVSRRSLTWILVQRRRPCVAAFAASLCGVGDLIGRRNVHKGNHTTKWSDSTCISGYIWWYQSLWKSNILYNLSIYIYVLYSFLGLQSLHYVLLPCIFGAFEHISGIVIKIRNSEHVQYFRAIRSKKTWPQFRAQICAIERK